MNSFVRLGTKKLLHPLLPISEDPFNIAPHKKPVDERSAARAIAHVVQAERASVALFEGVRVMPQGVGASKLDINEAVRRIPFGDFGPPADGEAVNSDAVVDECARTHFDGRGREYLKFQPRRREGLQIPRVGEEGELKGVTVFLASDASSYVTGQTIAVDGGMTV